MKLKEIEKRMIDIKKEMAGKEKELHSKVKDFLITQPQLDRMVGKENESLIQELDQLEIQRKFILDTKKWYQKWWEQIIIGVVAGIIILVIGLFLK